MQHEKDKREAYLHQLECLDQINQHIIGGSDLKTVMERVLDVVLEIYSCDRSCLLYPCNPIVKKWDIAFKRSRSGNLETNIGNCPLLFTPDTPEIIKSLLLTNKAITGKAIQGSLKTESEENFSQDSHMMIAVHPKNGQPWIFCLGQNNAERIWSKYEKSLLKKLSLKIGQALDVLLTLKQLRDSKEKLLEQLSNDHKLKTIDTRVRVIAHEFNNILSIILGNNELIMIHSDKLSQSHKYTEEIRIAGLKAKDLINQLSALSLDNEFDIDHTASSLPSSAPQNEELSFIKPLEKGDLTKTAGRILENKSNSDRCGRLLLIEDDPKLRKLFASNLSSHGYQVLEARDGKEGVALFSEAQPDLVITDLIMPEKEGIETIIEIKRNNPNAIIIAVSGGGRNHPDDYLKVAKALGAHTTFSKPIDWPKLLETIDELLS